MPILRLPTSLSFLFPLAYNLRPTAYRGDYRMKRGQFPALCRGPSETIHNRSTDALLRNRFNNHPMQSCLIETTQRSKQARSRFNQVAILRETLNDRISLDGSWLQ